MNPSRLLLAAAMLAFATSWLAVPAWSQAPPDVPPLGDADGERIYREICQGCHMPDGAGATGGGAYPAFTDNPRLASSTYLAVVVLNGRRNMPAFRRPAQQDFFFEPTWLSDQQVADVVNYLRTEFAGISEQPISAADVAALQTP